MGKLSVANKYDGIAVIGGMSVCQLCPEQYIDQSYKTNVLVEKERERAESLPM